MKSTIVANEKSTHRVPVFKLGELLPHPTPETTSLSLAKIADTDYVYCANTQEWKNRVGTLVCWIPPDSLVDVAREEFSFLAVDAKWLPDCTKSPAGTHALVKAKKLRGVVSYGLLVPAPTGLAEGDDAAEALGVIHYEPVALTDNGKQKGWATGGEVAKPPSGVYPKYDVDAFMAYGRKVFQPGEAVYVTEKIHGSNGRFVFKDEVMYCGSRTEWKREFPTPPQITLEELTEKIGNADRAKEVYERAVVNFQPKRNMWWTALDSVPTLCVYCENNPGYTVYGEVYGSVQKGFSYGVPAGEVRFAAFDILRRNGTWMDSQEFLDTCRKWNIPTVPVISESIAFDFDAVVKLAEGKTTIPGATHIREGVVVAPVKERWENRLGRVKLKVINPEYSLMKH